MKIKSYLKITMMFLMELETKSKREIVINVIIRKMKIKFNSDDNLPLSKSL